MGRTKAEADQELQTKPSLNENDTVKASAIKEYYESGAYSPAEVAEHFNVEEVDVMRVLKLDQQGEDLDEFNQPRKPAETTSEDE